MGIHQRHGRNFRIDRPEGSGDFLFLIFKTDAEIVLENETVHVPPNTGLLYAPEDRQLYFGTGDTYVNHYVHFEMEPGDPEYSLVPSSRVLYLGNVTELEMLLVLLSREMLSETPNRDRSVDYLLRLLLNAVSDGMTLSRPTAELSRHGEELVMLRSKLYASPAEFASVTELSESVNISASHFQMLYRKMFGVSCYDDLLTAKTLAAEHMLLTTGLTVREIASLSGFPDETGFMRCFKKRTGFTPSGYRRQQLKKEEEGA